MGPKPIRLVSYKKGIRMNTETHIKVRQYEETGEDGHLKAKE